VDERARATDTRSTDAPLEHAMTYPVIEPRDEERSGAAGKAVAVVTSFILFLAGLGGFALAFEVDEAWRAWTFGGALLVVTLAFMLPTTIIPALEGED
jgi:hypothetical protein